MIDREKVQKSGGVLMTAQSFHYSDPMMPSDSEVELARHASHVLAGLSFKQAKTIDISLETGNHHHSSVTLPLFAFKLLVSIFFAFLLVTSGLFAEQKVVLISGATSGIGLATVKAFQEKGWKVWAGFRQYIPDELKTMENVSLCHLDVTDDTLVQETIETILKKDARIDALVNNAGYGLIGVEECVSLKEAQHLFDVNFFGCLRLIQGVLPTMRQQQSGHIINISSGVGVHSLPGLGLYSASKFALEGLSESLAATLSHWNIKVSVVEPGFVKNDWGKHCVIGSRPCNEEFYKKLNQGICSMLSIPQGQPSRDVANLIVAIAETSQPSVRYQTNTDMTEWIAEKLVDPTGMTSQQSNLDFIKRTIESK